MISLLSCALFGALPHSAATEADDSHQYPNIQFEEISDHGNDFSGAPIKFPQVENKKAELSGYSYTGANMASSMQPGQPLGLQGFGPMATPVHTMPSNQPLGLQGSGTSAMPVQMVSGPTNLGMGPSMQFPTQQQAAIPVQHDYITTNPHGGVEEVKRAANLAMTLYNCLRKYMCDNYRVCNDPSFPPLGLGQGPMPRPTQPPQTTYTYNTRPQIMPNPSTIAGNGQRPNFQNPYPTPKYPAPNPSTIAGNGQGPNFQNPGWSYR